MIYVSTCLSREKDVGHTLQIPEIGVSKVTLVSVCWKVDQHMNDDLDFMALKILHYFFKELLELDVGLDMFEVRKRKTVFGI